MGAPRYLKVCLMSMICSVAVLAATNSEPYVAVSTQGQEQAIKSNNNGGGSGGGQEEAVKLPQAILDVIQNAHLDVDDIQAAGNAALMVGDDNMPGAENIPQQDTNNNNNNNNIMSGWQHSGICACRSAIRMNATPMLKSLNTSDEINDPTNLQLFEALLQELHSVHHHYQNE